MQNEPSTKDIFLQAQNERKKIFLTYFSGEQNLFLTKLCVPIQYLESISEHGPEFFYFWDDEGDVGDRVFGVPPSEIKYIEITDEVYEPKNYILPYNSDI